MMPGVPSGTGLGAASDQQPHAPHPPHEPMEEAKEVGACTRPAPMHLFGAGGRLEVHHIVALAEGGQPYDLRNLATLCSSCHHQEEARK